MKMKVEVRECEKHGQYEFVLESNGTWRCKGCRVDAVINFRRNSKRKAVRYLGGKCQICEYDKCLRALEFHHINPTKKDFGIASDGITRPFEKLKVELQKCVLVCANCHREIHEGITDCPPLFIDYPEDEPTPRRNYRNFCDDKPTKEELEKLVWEKSLSKIALQYGVALGMPKKWCKKLGIETPPVDYWVPKKRR